MDFYHWSVRASCRNSPFKLVSRLLPDNGGKVQTLLICYEHLFEVVVREKKDGGIGISSDPLPTYAQLGSFGQLQPYVVSDIRGFVGAVWDVFSSSLLLITLSALLQLTCDNVVRLLAGHEEDLGNDDGSGEEARFYASGITTNGTGTVYILDNIDDEDDDHRIRKVQLPPSLAGSWPRAAAPESSSASSAAAAAADPSTDIVVTTMPLRGLKNVKDLTFVRDSSGGGSLVYSTATALYRVALGEGGDLAGGEAEAVLLAGLEGQKGDDDGDGSGASFRNIHGLAVDAARCLYVLDNVYGDALLHKVTPAGRVMTLAETEELNQMHQIAILPQGYLAAMGRGGGNVTFIDFNLTPVPLRASAAPPPQPVRTLVADLGALLDRQPDDTADVSLLVSGRTFAAHRSILVARCDYFQQRLSPAGGFADATSQQPLSLPEADPEAFALVLRYLYTGAVVLPRGLATGVAELADRLLLPDLCREAQSRVLAEVSAETVVGALVWAHARGPMFSALLSDLKAWYLEHQDEVIVKAPAFVKRLMAENPDLMFDLYANCKRRRMVHDTEA